MGSCADTALPPSHLHMVMPFSFPRDAKTLVIINAAATPAFSSGKFTSQTEHPK